jgi:SAM-dependent methyltransferase
MISSQTKMAGKVTPRLDSQEWLHRWDRQQEIYIPNRETCYQIMFDALAHFLNLNEAGGDGAFLALDLACGPGSISQRLLARFPAARAVAVDIDPVLMRLGQDALGDLHGRLRWVEADLRWPDWIRRLPERGFDAVLSSTAIHWFDPARLANLYQELAQVMRPGGVFLNFDAVAASHEHIQEYYNEKRKREQTNSLADGQREDWQAWWEAIAQETTYQPLVAERKRRFEAAQSTGTNDLGVTMAEQASALYAAGFMAVDTLWQDHKSRIIIALPGK